MNFLLSFKQKSIGFYIICAAALLGLIATVMYLAFGISSSTFSAKIFVCLLIATLAGISVVFYDGFVSDILVLAMVILFALSLGFLVVNSAGDFTEFLTPVGMYGNADNMGMRFAIAGVTGGAAIVGICGCFFKRIKYDLIS